MTLEDLDIWRKRLIYRSWHRGTREMDLLLGRFADSHVPGFGATDLAQFEEVLQRSDPDLYSWMTGQTLVPPNLANPVLSRLLAYRFEKID